MKLVGSEDDSNEQSYPDLLCGFSPYHVRILCEKEWEGGYGYTPEQVGNMTLDNVLMLLMDKKLLRKRGLTRTTNMPSVQAADYADKDGWIKGKAKDGTPIKGKVSGKSVARRLMEEEQRKKNGS